MKLREAVGEALRRRRLAQGRTLREVAAAAGVSLTYLSEVERGRKEASSEVLEAVCAALHLALADLFLEVAGTLAAAELASGGMRGAASPAVVGFLALGVSGRATMRGPAEPFVVLETRSEPAGKSVLSPRDAEQLGHETTASYRPGATSGTVTGSFAVGLPMRTPADGLGGTMSATTGRRTRLRVARASSPPSGRSLLATTRSPTSPPGGSNVNQTGLRRQRRRSSRAGVFSNRS